VPSLDKPIQRKLKPLAARRCVSPIRQLFGLSLTPNSAALKVTPGERKLPNTIA